MEFYKAFFTNLSLLITFAYLMSLIYKYLFMRASYKAKHHGAVAIFIVAGWISMLFGFQVTETALFDLRYVPIILGALVYRHPATLLIIGAGIGLGRLAFGLSEAAWVGAANMVILGIVAAGMTAWFNRSSMGYAAKSMVAIAVIHFFNCLNIAVFGVIPAPIYLYEIAPITTVLGIAISAFFIFIVRDFHKEQLRLEELRKMNLLLRRQTRQLREAKRDLEEKAAQLAQSSQYKSEFLANMSHELKTPLNSIILLSGLLQEQEQEQEREQMESREQPYSSFSMDTDMDMDMDRDRDEPSIRYATLIHTAGNELLQLINNILDLSKVEAGKMELMLEQVPIVELVKAQQYQIMPVIEQKGLLFSLHVADDVCDTMITDGLRVNQVLRNLLANALKFTQQGSITVQISMESEPLESKPKRRVAAGLQGAWRRLLAQRGERSLPQQGASSEPATGAAPAPASRVKRGWLQDRNYWVLFAVQDTGIGIDEEKQEQIFQAFMQEDGTTTRQYGGTGLGLSISLQLARLLGGTLEVQSRKGEGSTFTLRLPLKHPDAPPCVEEGEEAEVASGT